MAAIEIKPGIFWIGVDDRTTDLFEGLWSITKEGISYNTYLINDEKKAIIDLTKSFKADEFFRHINEITDISNIDYVIVNHMEPDHSGVLRTLRMISPDVTIIGSEKAKDMIESFYGITENVKVVNDGDEISLGEKTLKFFSTPMVHWPETIMTYEISNRILFSCDAFGGYGALGGSIFDDECLDIEFYKQESLRYYVNIVARFSKMVEKAVKKLADVLVDIVAPSHGLIWRKNPEEIIDLYLKWAGYASGKAEVGVTLLYGSMYGNTEVMMNSVAQGIAKTGIPLDIFDVSRTHVSYILPSLWTKNGVMVGAPTYENSLFPTMRHTIDMAVQKNIVNKKAARFGSYGWSGGAQREFEKILEPVKWDIVDSFEFKGGPTKEDLKKGEEFGFKFGEIVKAM